MSKNDWLLKFKNVKTGVVHAAFDGYFLVCRKQMISDTLGALLEEADNKKVTCKKCLKLISEQTFYIDTYYEDYIHGGEDLDDEFEDDDDCFEFDTEFKLQNGGVL